ncbi:hypothetical protein E3N88_40180 [Mikania micrantha]|uniref:Uncharacterized protein n=1 Tax=Mikania micrantha TaxID=192012 RepID=A0A5N6LLV7_9ASTR|nr:hypothetical protein E3N88_40180 [Mikania micrantha]
MVKWTTKCTIVNKRFFKFYSKEYNENDQDYDDNDRDESQGVVQNSDENDVESKGVVQENDENDVEKAENTDDNDVEEVREGVEDNDYDDVDEVGRGEIKIPLEQDLLYLMFLLKLPRKKQ